jgi:BirA family transcriptional regulator, biotin operon repressor / biotin---[acetyl-CoA-carboxylase] ligase
MPVPLDLDRIVRETWIASAEHHEEIDSTNDRAKRSAVEFFRASRDDRPALPRLIIADRQTMGRGRGSNRWWTGDGALALTVLVDLQQHAIPIRQAPLLAITAGVALWKTTHHTLRDMFMAEMIHLHWPNDIYVGDSKLAGILIELVSSRYAAIGIGVNLNNDVEKLPEEVRCRKIVSLKDLLGETIVLNEYSTSLMLNLEEAISVLKQEPHILTKVANRLCYQSYSTIRVTDGERTSVGTCLGINENGGLLLETKSGIETFMAGTTEILD